MRKMKNILFSIFLVSFFIFISLSFYSKAQAKRVLSLKEAVSIAISQNPEVSAAIKEKESLFFKKNIVRAEFFPKLYLSYNYNYQKKEERGKNIPILDRILDRHQYRHQFGLMLTWNVFSGFSTWYAYQEALRLVEVSDALVKAKIQDIALRVVSAYLDYLKTKSLYEASLNDVEDAKVLLKLAQKRYEVGLSPLADVLNAEAKLKESEANSIKYKYTAEIAKTNLLTLLNLSVLEAKDTELLDFPEELLTDPDFESLLSLAKKKRPELLAKEKEILAQENRIKSVKGEYFPTIDLFTSLYRVDKSFFPDRDSEFTFGIKINLPLFTGFSTPAKVSAERATLEKKNFEKRALELSIEQEVFSAYQTYLTKKEYYFASLAWLKKMEEDYRMVKKRYENGLASIVDLTTTLARLSQARSQVATSRYDWYKSYFVLKRSAGFIPGLE
jgi:TolC family type I secretion outer membrane protein